MRFGKCTGSGIRIKPSFSISRLSPITINRYVIKSLNESSWYKIAESVTEIPFSPNGLAIRTAAGKAITVGICNGQLIACAHKCPHAGGILADGYIDSLGNIVCPLHRYKFDPRNGRNVSGEGFFLKTFAIEEKADGVYVNIPGL